MSDGDFQRPYYSPEDVAQLNTKMHLTMGVVQIYFERNNQIFRHKITAEDDYKFNADFQLVDAAIKLLKGGQHPAPEGWDEGRWNKMLNKSDERRLIIAGALIAAEIDRLNYTQ